MHEKIHALISKWEAEWQDLQDAARIANASVVVHHREDAMKRRNEYKERAEILREHINEVAALVDDGLRIDVDQVNDSIQVVYMTDEAPKPNTQGRIK